MSKLQCLYVDTCLPCYWLGSDVPSLAIPYIPGHSTADIKHQLCEELDRAEILEERGYDEAYAAILAIDSRIDILDKEEEDTDELMHYFIFKRKGESK